VPNNDLVTYEVHASLESGFTANEDTKLTETTGTFFAIRLLADDSPIPYDNYTFVRIVAKDPDGSAATSAQGFSYPDQVNSGDFGSVENLTISDGVAPSASPASFTVTAGIGYLFLTWDEIPNGDQVTYEIHMGTTAGFTPTAATLALETVGGFCFVRKRPLGFGGGALTYLQTYQIKIWAKDRDGYAPAPSPAQPGTPVKTGSTDIANGAVGTLQIGDAAIVSAKIADLAVGEAKIQNAAISTAKIANAAITNAKIGNLAVGTAQIADLAVGTAKISDAAITTAKVNSLSADVIDVGTLAGITITGNTIDGNAITGNTITGGTITGATVRSADSGNRVEMASGGSSGFVDFYSGAAEEEFPGYLWAGDGVDPFGNPSGFFTVRCPELHDPAGAPPGAVEMWHRKSNGNASIRFTGDAEFIYCAGTWWASQFNVYIGQMGASTELRFRVEEHQTRIWHASAVAETRFQTDGQIVVYHSGSPVWATGVAISDAEFKENVTPYSDSTATWVLQQIPLKNFSYRQDAGAILPLGPRMGVLAQDVQAVFPEGVHDIGGTLLLDHNSLIPLLMGAVRNLDARLQEVEVEVAAAMEG
jgi:hypothetical protein